MQRWLEVVYPQIQARAKAESAENYWADETKVKHDTAWVRGFAPAGKTPVLPHAARWTHVPMISTIINQGLVRFALHEGSMNIDRLIDFMDRLVRDVEGRRVFLIHDNLRVHHALAVKEWLATRDEQIEGFYLPSYTPDASSGEYLSRDLKTSLRSQEPKRTRHELSSAARAFLSSVRKTRRECAPTLSIRSSITHVE